MFQFATASKILFGAGSLAQLPVLVGKLGTRVLLVLGASRRHQDRVVGLLATNGQRVDIVSVGGEPTVEDIVEWVAEARRQRSDVVVAVGGGSAIDAAKAVAALASNPGDPMDYLEVVGRGQPLRASSLPVIAIPTTSGTGAEVTNNAVLLSREHRVKVSLRSESMLPEVALVDPELSLSLPPTLTATTGLDALTQVLEPYVSCQANPITDALSLKGVELARSALRGAFHDGGNPVFRRDMALTSVLGGLSLANSKLGAVHGLAGPLGGMFPAPHGAICARLLPLVFRQNVLALRERRPQSSILLRFDELAQLMTGRSSATALDGADWLGELVDELGVPPLGTFGLTSSAVDEVVDKASHSSSMKGNPISLSRAELSELVRSAL